MATCVSETYFDKISSTILEGMTASAGECYTEFSRPWYSTCFDIYIYIYIYLAIDTSTTVILYNELQCLVEPSVLTIATMENVAMG